MLYFYLRGLIGDKEADADVCSVCRYHHVGLTAPASLFTPERIRAAWALARLRHPPLAATLRMEPGAYDSARFVYAPPRSVADALKRSEAAMEFCELSKDALLDRFLNGPRTLGPDRLAFLFVASEPGQESAAEGVRNFDVMCCATHFLGDGMALNRFMNEFFELLGGRVSADTDAAHERTTAEIEALLAAEWEASWGAAARAKLANAEREPEVYPRALEDSLPLPEKSCGILRAAAIKVDFENTQKKLIVRSLSLHHRTFESEC